MSKMEELLKNLAEASRYFKLAAEQGSVDAQIDLGTMCEHVHGVPKDPPAAVRLYNLAVTQGSMVAHCRLGHMFASGLGVKQDYQEAIRLYKLAAQHDHTEAQYAMGLV